MTPTPIGITVERYTQLRRYDQSWKAWCDRHVTALPTIRLQPRNEGLTSWVSTRHYIQPSIWTAVPGEWEPSISEAEIRHYDVIIHTPPGRPEWLALLADEDLAA